MIVDKRNAEHYIWGNVCDGWHLLKSDGLSVIQERVPPGGSELGHFHERSHQFFFVLSGIMTMIMGEERHVVKAGQGISVSPGVAHKMLNESDSDVEFLVISSPRSHGDRVVVE